LHFFSLSLARQEQYRRYDNSQLYRVILLHFVTKPSSSCFAGVKIITDITSPEVTHPN
jgi:hypothetical protein